MSRDKKIRFIILSIFSFIIFSLTYCKTYPLSAINLDSGSSLTKDQSENYSWKLINAANVGYTNFVIIDSNSPNVVYAGVNVGGVFKSYNYGEHWMPANKGLIWPADRLVAALTIDSKNGIMYLGVGGFGKGGIFKSTDQGESWQLLTRKVRFNGLGVKQTRGKGLIVINPLDSKIIYAGSYKDGLFKSTDGGETWFGKGLKGKHISSIVINPSNQQIIYVSTVRMNKQEGGIYKSTDGGNSWRRIGDNIVDVYQLVMNHTDPDIIYAACGIQGVFKTIDGGETWVKKNKGLEGLILSKILSKVKLSNIGYISLALDLKNPNVIYVGSGKYRGQIYKSTNKGDHWVNLTNNQRNIYTDGWWIQKMNWPGGKSYSANSLSIDPENNKRIYVTGRSGIWRSDDGGIKWKAKVKGFEGASMLGIAVHPGNPDIFFVGESDYVMFRTMDGGGTFDRPLKGIGNWDIEESKDVWQKYRADKGLAFAIDPRNNPFAIYVGTAGSIVNTGTVFKSTDGGETWHEANKGLPVASVTALAINQTNYDILFAILQEHGLYKTIDGGKTWEKIYINVGIMNEKMFQWKTGNLILIHPKFSDVIYILDKKSGVYKTVNGGLDWKLISRDLPQGGINGMDRYVGGMSIDYKNPDTVYIGLRNHGVYKTTDGGRKWKKVTPSYIRHGGAMSIDPLDGSIYLASVPASGEEDIKGFIPGIYKSTDKGKNWVPIHNDDLLKISLKVRYLTLSNGKIYISTQGNGIIIGEPKK